MTYKDAIKYLIPPVTTSTEPSAEYLKQKEAYDLAIKALEERPQGDLISREALLKRVDEERKYLIARGQTDAEHILVHNFRDLIDNATTVDFPDWYKVYEEVKGIFERPQGQWIEDEFGSYCDKCGVYAFLDRYERPIKSLFCPNCGAKMGGSKEC